MHRFLDPIELPRAKRRDGAIQLMRQAAEAAWSRRPIRAPAADCDPDSPIAMLSPEQTLDAMYQGAVDIRLELIYSPTIAGDLRKRWTNRLGDINLRAPTATTDIRQLHDEIALHETGWDQELDCDLSQIRQGLSRLRELCARKQVFAESEKNDPAARF